MKIFSVFISVIFLVFVILGFYVYCITHPWGNSYESRAVTYFMREKILVRLIIDILLFILSAFLTLKKRYTANTILLVCYIGFIVIKYISMHQHG